MATITSAGLGSGLDVSSLVDQLVAAEGQPQVLRLDTQEAKVQAELSALGSLKSAFADFQSSLGSFKTISSFTGRVATTSDNTIFTTSATQVASPGTFSLEVTNLAEAHKVKSSVFASKSSVVGSGTMTFQFGTYASGPNTFTLNPKKVAQVVTIPSSSNTLQGIRDAVNNADIGVSANIIDDGSGPRLVFSSTDTGAANSLKITTDDDDLTDTDTSGLSQIAYDPTAAVGSGENLTETVAAKDASFILDGITIASESNSSTTAIDGVTINLVKADPGKTHTLKVEKDTLGIKNLINSFISSYNGLNETLDSLASYDPETEQAGLLLGDATLRSMKSQTQQIIANAVDGIYDGNSSLAAIGITSDSEGMLKLDESVINEVLDNDIDAVGRIFAEAANPSDNLIEYVSSTTATTVGQYGVNITQLATQGDLVGSAAANLTITTGVNDTLVLDVDGVTATIVLTAGVYTAAALAAEVQSRANGTSEFQTGKAAITATESGGVITLTSDSYGTTSTVDITGGNGKTDFIGATPTATAGLDVAGTIGGVNATGKGQELTGEGLVSGLKLKIVGGSTGNRGTVSFARGIAVQLDTMLETFLKDQGVLDVRTDALNDRIDDIGDQRIDLERRLEKIEARYLKQFIALDQLVSQLQNTSQFLTTQLANLPGPFKKKTS